MHNISDIIELHLKEILFGSQDGVIEIKRSDLSDRFQCVPSQINYVISTRFTVEKGYLVESKRGGGGFIRIQRLEIPDVQAIHSQIVGQSSEEMSQAAAEGIIYRLESGKHISGREAQILRAAVSRDVLQLPLPQRDWLRARLLKSMLMALLK
jgi:transcriptional regulator CtsR